MSERAHARERSTGPHVLVLNSGSSSIKYQLLDMGAGRRLAQGLVERIGEGTSALTHESTHESAHESQDADEPYTRHAAYPGHEAALQAVLEAFAEAGPALSGPGGPGIEPAAVGHRVVHGGDRYGDPVLIDDTVEKAIADLAPLAPLHNPANLTCIQVARRIFPRAQHVAVFDTAFHQSLPPAAHTYAVPREWAALGVRRYGFHGTSNAYVSRRAAELLGRPYDQVNTIVLHLGNGASATAVEGGRSVETSMGLTPLEGLVMGTRSGDLDPALPAFLSRVKGMHLDEIDDALNTRSGLLGLAGANDLREVWRLVDSGDPGAALAMDVYCHRIRKYVGAYHAVLLAGSGHVDAVVFTAGVGENDPRVRARSLAGLERLGISVDAARNETPGRAGRSRGSSAPHGGGHLISADGAEVAVLVIPTDEEYEIAAEALAVVTGGRRPGSP
ncbi:MAG: acetate kinase [Streptosporangiaceae bacterium]|nr:acetate kinase [Streptosporangiaceae bacterium]